MSSILRVSPRNYLATLDSAAITAPASATGCPTTNLVRGGPGRFWQSAGSAVTHEITFDLGASHVLDFFALFDVRASVAIDAMKVEASDVMPFSVGGTFDLDVNARGDGCVIDPSIISSDWRAVRFTVTLLSAGTLRIGEAWAGVYEDTQRAYATMRRSIDYRTIANESEAGSVQTTQLGDYRHKFDLGFDRLFDSERDEVVSIFHEAAGGLNPIVLVPNKADASGVYHGRLTDSLAWTQDYPTNDGLAWSFTESGRAR